MSDIQVALAIQFAALVVTCVASGWRVALYYVGLVLFVWFLALMLNSVHIPSALHLLWIVPVIFAAWSTSNRLRKRISSKTTETNT